MTEELTLQIEGMTCDHCVMHVTRALKSLSGVNDAEVNLKKNNAMVHYDPSVVSPDDAIGDRHRASLIAVWGTDDPSTPYRRILRDDAIGHSRSGPAVHFQSTAAYTR